ncbi:putative oxidoreductase [Roseibium album]|nr:putative oxidoreductase [Roseibium album]
MTSSKLAVVAGAGGALGPALGIALGNAGFRTVGISRELPPKGFDDHVSADLADTRAAENAFSTILSRHGTPSVLIYNAHRFLIETFENTSPDDFEAVWRTDTLGAFVAAKTLLPSMLEEGGTVLFSGATASTRGSARFSAFASAKFALRGLAQSLAREYGPQGIHVAHIVIDGLIDGGYAQQLYDVPSADCISPEALAREYLNLIQQPRSVWSHEIDIRPFNGKF